MGDNITTIILTVRLLVVHGMLQFASIMVPPHIIDN